MAALLIVVNIVVVNIFAVSAAPVVASELAGILAGALAGAGYTQSEIDGMSLAEMNTAFNDGVNNGTIKIDMKVPVNDTIISFYDFLMTENREIGMNIIANSLSGFFDSYSVLSGEAFTPTEITDMNGAGVKIIWEHRGSSYKTVHYADYFLIDEANGSLILKGNVITEFYNCNEGSYSAFDERNYYMVDGYPKYENEHVFGGTNYLSFCQDYDVYGDVRYADGTQAPSLDSEVYEIGETTDGAKITLDMLNPDGTVTIDGVTYYPADYLDPDKLTEEGKKQLINNITNVINNTYVISEDKPIVDTDEIVVEVAEELQNYTVSPSIITVFPFCLPFDFVRGMKLFSAKPVTPHFEITIDVPAILNIPPQKWTLEIDLEKFEPLAKITRWLSLFGFSYLLIILSTKIVKGAGA